MPTRNIIKNYGAGHYYHAYNRGVDKMDIFRSPDDYEVMLGLFKRYLSPERVYDAYRSLLPNYRDKVELVAYCLMPNHYHLLLYLREEDGIELLMRSVMTAYSRYFNKKYGRVGTLFQNHFLAARITSDAYLWHVSRYIHLNPLDIGVEPSSYPYSSIWYYRGDKAAAWLHNEKLADTPEEKRRYTAEVSDSREYHALRSKLKYVLAHSNDSLQSGGS